MALMKVTPEEVTAASTKIKQASSNIESQLNAAGTDVSSMASIWEGTAKTSFDGFWEQWAQGARQVREALDGITQMLDQTATAYADTETQLANQFKQ